MATMGSYGDACIQRRAPEAHYHHGRRPLRSAFCMGIPQTAAQARQPSQDAQLAQWLNDGTHLPRFRQGRRGRSRDTHSALHLSPQRRVVLPRNKQSFQALHLER